MTEKTFDPRIAGKKAARDAGTAVVIAGAAAIAGALAQPEIASQISAAITGLVPPPWGLLAAPVGMAVVHGLSKFGLDWVRRRKAQPLGADAVAQARARYRRDA